MGTSNLKCYVCFLMYLGIDPQLSLLNLVVKILEQQFMYLGHTSIEFGLKILHIAASTSPMNIEERESDHPPHTRVAEIYTV